MKINSIFFLTAFIIFSSSVFAEDNVLLKIEDEVVTTDEFLHIYKKNNTSEDALNYKAMKEYMDLFVNFKLKVYEAKQLKLDTSSSFIKELEQYRSQLAQPYLTDKEVEKELIREAYERMKYDVDVSHVLVSARKTDLPEDTLKAYKRINEIYSKLSNGADFSEIAVEHSDDPSAVNNKGRLGYKTVFSLVYPFETQMYSTPVGEFSKPFRSEFGYHILKVNDKRPAKGRYKIAHIVRMTPEGSGSRLRKETAEKMQEIKQLLDEGADFGELAEKYSHDKRTASNDGLIGWISVGGRARPDFEKAVFSMNNVGEISEPLQTDYGWHIIKVVDIEPIKEFEEVKSNLKTRITNSARAAKSKTSVINRLKNEYEIIVKNDALEAFYSLVNDSIFLGMWNMDKNADLTKPILKIKDKNYGKDYKVFYKNDFYNYIKRYNRRQSRMPIEMFVNNKFDEFMDNAILSYEESILHKKNREFKYLINEYHDGILLFELTDLMVWSKAIKDSAGLADFHKNNKDRYMWDYRYKVTIYECDTERTANRMKRAIERNRNVEKTIRRLTRRNDDAVNLTMNNKFEKGANQEVDRLISKFEIPEEDKFSKTFIMDNNKAAKIEVFPPQHKKLSEAKGIITADYQTYLEQRWVEKLHNKYEVKIYSDVLKKISN